MRGGRARFACSLVVRLLADPVRWRVLQELARGDLQVRDLVAAAAKARA
jgi:hypothetical protein